MTSIITANTITYTTLTADGGAVISRSTDAFGVVLDELTYDGGSYDIIREADGMWHLYSKRMNDISMREAIGWTKGVKANDKDEATKMLFTDAFKSGMNGARIQFMTDADFNEIEAEVQG